jgi:hypothetical protein
MRNVHANTDDDLVHQLRALGIQIETTGQVFRTSSERTTNRAHGTISPIPDEVHFMNAELRHCEVLGVGILPCLFSGSGHVYEFVRTLRKCIYGKVKHAVELRPLPDRSGVFTRTNIEVAIKVMSKAIIERGNLQENPLVEIATQQYLSSPGHPNVLTLVQSSSTIRR